MAASMGLGPRVAQEGAVEVSGSDAGQPLQQPRLDVVVEDSGTAQQALRLVRHRLHHLGVAMAQVGDAVTGDAVDVLPAGVVPHLRALAAHQHHVALGIDIELVLLLQLLEVRH